MVFAALLSPPSHAQAGADCVSGGTTAQTNACAIKHFQQADTDNQILYGDVMRALSAHERPALRKEQNEWTRGRNLLCKKSQAAFEAQADWPRRFHECLAQQIQARDGVLKQWLHQGPPQ
ncbi:MAG: lysozyme inhibitor LprI family protein [Comamonas sp.]